LGLSRKQLHILRQRIQTNLSDFHEVSVETSRHDSPKSSSGKVSRMRGDQPLAEKEKSIATPTNSSQGKRWAPASELEKTRQAVTWRQHLGVLIPLLIIYFALAFYRITHQSFWVDEVSSLIDADPNAPFWAHEAWFSGRGPFHLRLLQLWARGFTGEFALRSLSPLLGSIAVCLIYLTGLRMGNRMIAQIAAVLFATSPFLIWYSQEVRYIILMIPAALLAMYAFDRILSTRRIGWWLLYGCSLILAIGTFMVNILLPVAQGLYLICSESRHLVLRKWLVSQLVISGLFIWWANGGYIGQLGGHWQKLLGNMTTSVEELHFLGADHRFSIGGSREFQAMALPYTFFAFSTGFSLGPSVRELQVSRTWAVMRPHLLSLFASSFLFGGLFLFGLVTIRRYHRTWMLLVLWLAVPIIGALVVSVIIPKMAYNVRYVAMSFPAYILIVSTGIASIRRPMIQISLLVAVISVNGLSLANYYFDPRYSREDARSAAWFLQEAAHPQDAILVVGSATALRYYYKGKAPIITWSKAIIDKQSSLEEHFQELNEHHDYVWLVQTRPWQTDPRRIVKAIFDANYKAIESKRFPGVDIDSYKTHSDWMNSIHPFPHTSSFHR
jgi:mannosyltransferase